MSGPGCGCAGCWLGAGRSRWRCGVDVGRLATVAAARAGGAAHLDELTRAAGLELEAFVWFSAAASTFGGAGQGNYAAANAFLDGLAQQRAGRGLAGLSVAWG